MSKKLLAFLALCAILPIASCDDDNDKKVESNPTDQSTNNNENNSNANADSSTNADSSSNTSCTGTEVVCQGNAVYKCLNGTLSLFQPCSGSCKEGVCVDDNGGSSGNNNEDNGGNNNENACSTDAECGSGYVCFEKKCVSEDDIECRTNSDCGDEYICDHGICVDPYDYECDIDADCGENETCYEGECMPTGVIPDCSSNSDCGENEICFEAECIDISDVPTCDENNVCEAGYICHPIYNVCIEIESTCPAPCSENEVCVEGECVEDEAECSSDKACSDPSQICYNGNCVDPSDIPSCDDGSMTCENGYICVDGQCVEVEETDTCTSNLDCSEGYKCDHSVCVEDVPADLCSATPYADEDQNCLSIDGVDYQFTCWSGTEITSQRVKCADSKLGSACIDAYSCGCNNNSDCPSGYVCNFEDTVCEPSSSASPTTIDFAPQTSCTNYNTANGDVIYSCVDGDKTATITYNNGAVLSYSVSGINKTSANLKKDSSTNTYYIKIENLSNVSQATVVWTVGANDLENNTLSITDDKSKSESYKVAEKSVDTTATFAISSGASTIELKHNGSASGAILIKSIKIN